MPATASRQVQKFNDQTTGVLPSSNSISCSKANLQGLTVIISLLWFSVLLTQTVHFCKSYSSDTKYYTPKTKMGQVTLEI